MPKPATQNIITCLTQFSIDTPDSINLIGFYGDLHNDSRAIVEGDIFCAIIGNDQDGRKYIEQAVKQGAKLVLAECESITEHGDVVFASSNSKVAMVKFYQLNQHLFNLTKNYYQSPQDNMTVVGITGTNGKTTTSQLLAQMLSAYDKPCAVIGTNGSGPLDSLQPIENTTPGACELHQLFNHFNDEH